MRGLRSPAAFLLAVLCSGALSRGDSHVAALFDLGFGARPLGMGGAFVALADDEGAAFYNPAGLGWLRSIGVSSFYTRPAGEITYGGFAVTVPWFGVTVTQLDSGPIESGEETFRYVTQAGLVSGGLALGPIGLGARLKLYRVSEPSAGRGVALDPAFLLVAGPVRVGGVLENALSRPIAFDTGHTEAWERRARIGVAVSLRLDRGLVCNAAIDVEGLLSPAPDIAGGVETWIGGLAGRVGYDGTGATAGLSLRFENFQMDWAMAMRPDLGDAHRVSLAFRF